jgi:hypothetical protein
MSTSPTVPSLAASEPTPLLDAMFGPVWPDRTVPGRPRIVAAAAVVGLLAAVVLPFRNLGVGTFAVLMAVCAVVAAADARLRTPYHLLSGALCTLLLCPLFLLDAPWVALLCLVAAFAVGSAALVDGRSVTGLLASVASVPLAGLRGLPWLGRSVSGKGTSRRWAPALRTVGISLLAVLVFGALFASADALFARWAAALVPDLSAGSLVLRGFVFCAVGGLALAGGYVAVNPPRVERLAVPAGRPVARRFEWLVPVSLVTVVCAVFVVAQLTAMFGGHAYLRRTTGLTYAEYVHQGFAQLTVVTLLTLGVVAAAARKAPQAAARDRVLLRVALGALCTLTLVVVSSALYRMHVYEQAYGFTRLRLLVSFFEGWLGLVVVLVMVAGVRLRGRWLPRAVLLSGAATLLGLAALNPDASIAEHNLARYQSTHRVDWGYLSSLSADATPVLTRLPADLRGCVSAASGAEDDWLEWNLGRARARSAPGAAELDGSRSCPSVPGR